MKTVVQTQKLRGRAGEVTHQQTSVGKESCTQKNEMKWELLAPCRLGFEYSQQLLARWHLMKARKGQSRLQGLKGPEKLTLAFTVGREMREQQAPLHQPTPCHHVSSLICSTCLLRLPNVNLKLKLHWWPSHWVNYF